MLSQTIFALPVGNGLSVRVSINVLRNKLILPACVLQIMLASFDWAEILDFCQVLMTIFIHHYQLENLFTMLVLKNIYLNKTY